MALGDPPHNDPSSSSLTVEQGSFSGSLELATTTLGFDFMSGSQQKGRETLSYGRTSPACC